MFEQATRLKLRFPSTRGDLTAEDLWDLPLTSKRSANLDDIAKAVNRQLKLTEEESFVKPHTAENETAALQLDILKHIIKVKQEENAAARAAVDNRQRKQHLLEVIARKQDAELEGKPLEELQKMADEL